jgi:hypothetical protein
MMPFGVDERKERERLEARERRRQAKLREALERERVGLLARIAACDAKAATLSGRKQPAHWQALDDLERADLARRRDRLESRVGLVDVQMRRLK